MIGFVMINENIQQKILELNATDKIHLVELIFESLSKTNTEIQDKWIKESEQRYKAFKKGKIKSYSYEEVMDMIAK